MMHVSLLQLAGGPVCYVQFVVCVHYVCIIWERLGRVVGHSVE